MDCFHLGDRRTLKEVEEKEKEVHDLVILLSWNLIYRYLFKSRYRNIIPPHFLPFYFYSILFFFNFIFLQFYFSSILFFFNFIFLQFYFISFELISWKHSCWFAIFINNYNCLWEFILTSGLGLFRYLFHIYFG